MTTRPADLPGLAWLARERGLPPARVLPFGLSIVPAFVLCPPQGAHGLLVGVAAALLVVASFAAVVLVPWGTAPPWTQGLPPVGYLLVLALLRAAGGPPGLALSVLLLLPLVWVALVGDRVGLTAVIAGSTAVLLLPLVGAAGTVPPAEWRRALLFAIVSPVIGLAVQRLVVGIRTSTERIVRLRASSEAIVRSVGDGLVVLDGDRRAVEVNDTALRLLGADREALLGRTLDDLADGARPVRGASAHRLDPAPDRSGPGVGSGEYLVRRGDGTLVPMKCSMVALNPADPTDGWVVAFRDITERLRARRLSRARFVVTSALSESSGYREALTRIAPGLGEVLDAAVVTFWDVVPAAAAGEAPTVELREYWEDPAAPRPEFARATHSVPGHTGLPGRVLDTGRPQWITDLAGTDPVRFPRARAALADGLQTFVALPLGSGDPVGVLQVDFAHVEAPDTLTRDLLEALAARIGDAARRERAEAESTRLKDEFTALVSHELRTPLTSISGYLELLADEIGDDPVPRRFLEVVGRNTARLRRLVEDLLFVARVDAGRMSLTFDECDVPGIVEAAIEMAHPRAAAAGLTLTARLDGPAWVRGDADRLGQVLDNLLSNAIKFSPPGREVEVRLSRTEGDPAARRAVLEVVDTGMGISERDMQRLFARFVRTAEAEAANIPGVGLGLVITRAIVDAHGGAITVDSTPGAGTTFRVELPLAAVRPVADPAGSGGGPSRASDPR